MQLLLLFIFSHCGLAATSGLQVKVTRKEGPSGQETELRMLQKGDHFGEKALDKYVMHWRKYIFIDVLQFGITQIWFILYVNVDRKLLHRLSKVSGKFTPILWKQFMDELGVLHIFS